MFKKAERKRVYLKIANMGPSGAGKTLGSLLVAKGLGKKICAIDTENGSMSLYSDRVQFDVAEMTPPYTTEKYIIALKEAERLGYDVCVVDSISHAWASEGGLLEQKDATAGNTFAAWGKLTPKQNKFISAITHCQMDVIVTMRSKQDYVLVDKGGKQVPEKVGMAAVQREGIEYEFTTVFDLSMNHYCQVSKDRTGLFDGQNIMLTEEVGQALARWRDSATGPLTVLAPQAPPPAPKPPQTITEIVVGEPGDFVCKFGKYKGKKLSEIDIHELDNYVTFIQDELAKKTDPPKPITQEFLAAADAFFETRVSIETGEY